ncbi:MAG: tryptophan synthase subunit alpha [Halanaerobium sp.]
MEKAEIVNKTLNDYLMNKKSNNEKILVAFLPAFYPDKSSSLKLINYLLDNGVDALELGFPSADAKKDGKTIRKANKKVLSRGFQAADYFDFAAEVNKNYKFNRLAAMGYWQDLKKYLTKNYQQQWQKAGIRDLIIPDLEEDKNLDLIRDSGYNLIPILDSAAKIDSFKAGKEAFLYCPTHSGKTGADKEFDLELLRELKTALYKSELAEKPHLAGFGISSAEDVKNIMKLDYDGVIVGSEFINKINQNFDAAANFLDELKTALNKV